MACTPGGETPKSPAHQPSGGLQGHGRPLKGRKEHYAKEHCSSSAFQLTTYIIFTGDKKILDSRVGRGIHPFLNRGITA